VGFSRERPGKDGKTRYAAIYRDIKGRQRSAGTFATERQADKAWQRAEAVIGLGRVGDPSRGRQTFQHYVEETWFPNHEVEATTRQGYSYVLYRHIMPEFGPMRMVDILPEHVREWVTSMKAKGLAPASIAGAKVILSAIFTTALNDQVTFLHPCKGVKIPPVPIKPRTIITPEQFAELYEALPDDDSRLFVETAIESGARWGELAELRVRDLDFSSRMLTISRAVVEVLPRFHPQGGRFLVKDYPKDRESRRFKLSAQITVKLKAHVTSHQLGCDDLLFKAPDAEASPVLAVAADPETLGHTEPNAAGRRYRHGTMTGYSSAGAAVSTAEPPTPATGQSAAPRARTIPGTAASWTLTATSQRAGSVTRSGSRR
jgi:integrase